MTDSCTCSAWSKCPQSIISETTAPFDQIKAAIKDVCTHCSNIAVVECNIGKWGYGSPQHSGVISLVASHCSQLRKIYTRTGLVDDDLAALGAGCPALTTVDTMSAEVTDAGLLAIARNGALRALHMEGCLQVTDEGLQAVVSLCPHLESVDITSCEDLITDSTLIALGQHCRNLRKLKTGYTYVTEEGLEAIAAGCPLLENLDVSACMVGPAIEAIARNCPLLRVLIVSEVEVPTEAMLALAECCPLLEELGLCGCPEFGDEEITALVGGCPDLQRLDIKRTAVTEVGLCAIREHCKKLKHITLDDGMYPGGVVDDSFFPAGVEVTLAY
jgi:hypothetical protein